jgi:hypothetical protein
LSPKALIKLENIQVASLVAGDLATLDTLVQALLNLQPDDRRDVLLLMVTDEETLMDMLQSLHFFLSYFFFV